MSAPSGPHPGRWWLALAAVAALAGGFTLAAPTPPVGADANEAPASPGIYRSLSAGAGHACARLTAGRLKCWGSGAFRQTGYADYNPRSSNLRGVEPGQMGADLETVFVGTGRSVSAVTAGFRHTCAILDDGTVRCWGGNYSAQLGQGSAADTLSPGDDLPPVALGTGRTARDIASGSRHNCAILDDHSLKCWGLNNNGELGLGDTTRRGNAPGQMGDALPAVDLGAGRTAIAVAGGDAHTCALLDDGGVKCWGNGGGGRLGGQSTDDRGNAPGEMGDALPTVDLGTGRTATAVTVGSDYSCALLDNGTVKCWGANDKGQLGLGDVVARGGAPGQMGDALPAVDLGTGRTAVAMSADSSGTHTCALLDNGTVKCWGANADGQLGQGTTNVLGDAPGEMGDALPPVDLGTGRTALALTTGGSSTCAVLDNATLKCWGNGAGLGLGDTRTRGDGPGEMGDALPPVALEGGGVAGQIRGADGTARAGLVAVLRADDHTFVRGEATSNSMYAMALPPGQYLLYVFDRAGDHQSGLYGAPSTVTVTGDQTAVADPVLSPARGTITGTVTETGSGTPLPGVSVVLSGSSATALSVAATTDASGDYTITGLAPGSYLVGFVDGSGAHQVRFHPSAATTPDATAVTVTAGGTATADGVLPTQPTTAATAAFTGRVTRAGTTNAIASGVLVIALRASDHSFVGATTTSTTSPYGYSLPVPDGTYKLLFMGRTDVAPEWHDDQPITGLAQASPVAAPAVINPALSPTLGRLSVVLSEDGSDGLYGDWVIVIGPTGIVGVATTDSGGSDGTTVRAAVEFAGLPVGNYRVALVEPFRGIIEFYQDAPDHDSATSVAVTGGDTTTMEAILGP